MNTPINVLFIEDNPGDARLVKEELRLADSRTVVQLERVERLDQGLERLTANHFEAILLDLSLPDSEGLDTLQRVLSQASRIPVIVMTGQADEEVGIKAMQAGAQDYLIKGQVNGSLLRRVIQYAIQRKQAEEELKEKERLLTEAQRIGHIGSWNYDIPTDVLQYSDEMYRLFDVAPQEFQHNREGFLSLIYSVDRPEVTGWMERITSGRQVKELDFRVFHKKGELRYIQSRGAIEFDAMGRPARFIGMAQDITERKLADLQIQQQIQQFKALRKIDQAISSSFDLRFTLNTVLSQVITQLQVDAAVILLLDPDEQTLVYAAGQGLRTHAAETARVPVGEGHAGRVAQERRLIKIENLKDQPDDLLLTVLLAGEDFVSYHGIPLIAKGEVKGVLEIFHRVPLQPYPEWLDFLNALAGQAAIAIENTKLFESLQDSNRELFQAYDATIEGWSRAMDLRDRETEGHGRRVADLTVELARGVGIREADISHLRRGALLHDIGKIGIPDSILHKPDKLTDQEWIVMRKHPQFAYDMLYPIEYLRPALDIPYNHHEKWDGTGYPRGTRGEAIPLAARLFAVIDVWDALTSDRPYRPAWSEAEALTYIREQSGRHFDPQVVELFFKRLK